MYSQFHTSLVFDTCYVLLCALCNFLSFCLQEYHKGLGELEGQLDELEGLGMLLASGCVSEDKEIIVQRTKDLRYKHVFLYKTLLLRWPGIKIPCTCICGLSTVLVHVC